MSNFLDGLPPSLRIGPYDIAIIIKDKVSEADDAGLYHNGISINLKKDQYNPIFAVDTVLHEINHCIYRCAGLGKAAPEETAVTAMATGLTQVFRDNPKLLKWLQKVLGHET